MRSIVFRHHDQAASTRPHVVRRVPCPQHALPVRPVAATQEMVAA